jgi:hypothetical protein
MTLWFVYDRTTGDPTKGPPGFRGETGIYVAASGRDEARVVGWRHIARHATPSTIGQRPVLVQSRHVRAEGRPRVVPVDEARELMGAT